MIATPSDVLPLVEPAVDDLRSALRKGVDYADDLQSEFGATEIDRHFWAHSARYRARRHLISIASGAASWKIAPGISNSAIHLQFEGGHTARVLRSLGGEMPHPGRNRQRRAAWDNPQLELDLAEGHRFPLLRLIIDWHVVDGEPVIHVGLPRCPWDYLSDPVLHWREPITGDIDLDSLAFAPAALDDDDEVPITLQVDPAEREAK